MLEAFRWLFARSPEPPSHVLVRRTFLSLLGCVYTVAIGSFWIQAHALIGSRGILPLEQWLPRARERLGASGWWDFPTLLWWWPSDAGLHALCALGLLASFALVAGLVPRVAAAVCWLVYLSIVNAGEVFLGFQWDALLLETGLIAIGLAPNLLGPSWDRAARMSRAPLWLLRWLVFRLIVLSGAVKLASGDPTWRDCSALTYHYWTQPLPHVLAWYVDQLPPWFHQRSCELMFAIELGLAWLVFAPRKLRCLAALSICVLMAIIGGTGNYGFFNLLSVVLCVPLLDDGLLLAALPKRWRERVRHAAPAPEPARWRTLVAFALAALVTVHTGYLAAARAQLVDTLPAPVRWLHRQTDSFRSFNTYGLFAVMTTERPEIVIEGSLDSVEWRAYEFRWKPTSLERAPGFAGAHMPRIDWQMWFAALGHWRGNNWYLGFVQRLLEASPVVLAQLELDPFGGQRPRYVRSTLYHYRFTTSAERAHSGAWWKRELVGPYCPTLELVDGKLSASER